MSAKAMTGLILGLLGSTALAQEVTPAPSLELLEFLAEFGDIDAETFDVIEYHAQQDAKPEPRIESEAPTSGGDLK